MHKLKRIVQAAAVAVFMAGLYMSSAAENTDRQPECTITAEAVTVTAEITGITAKWDFQELGCRMGAGAGYELLKLTNGMPDVEAKESCYVASMEQPEEPPEPDPVVIEAEIEPVIPIPSNRWGITLTDEETDLLAKIVWLEAQGESEKGQEAVVEVVLNRMASSRFPDTLYEVLSQSNPVQFDSWKLLGKAAPTEKEYQSIERVLNGSAVNLNADTVYFATKPLTKRIDQRIGGHVFCM